MTTGDDLATRFAKHLERLAARGDARSGATLAALRRGLGKQPGEAPEMFPYLVPWTAELDNRTQETYYLVASLFGMHPVTWPRSGAEEDHDRWRRNFGASMRWVAGPDTQEGGTERRFVGVLNSRRDELPDRLRQAVRLCRSKDVPVDWAVLTHDLLGWDHPRRRTQRSWARAFWTDRVPEDSDHDATLEDE
jgi:CRISPR system Cascade subunit CasB